METFNLAGISHHNDITDGGEYRQDLLKTIYERNNGTNLASIVLLNACVFHNPETNVDEDAIKVYSVYLDKVVGYVSRQDIQALMPVAKSRANTMVLSLHKSDTGFFTGRLHVKEFPTKKQYAVVKRLYESKYIRKMPYYDKTVYSYVIQQALTKKTG